MISKSSFLQTVGLLAMLALVMPTGLHANKTPVGPPVSVDPPSICDAIVGNLVANCGFETGTFANWNPTNATSGSDFGVTSTASNVNSGTYAADFGAVTPPFTDSIHQTLATTGGNSYNVSFYLSNDGCTTPSQCLFTASWDGVTEYIAPTTAFGYTHVQFTALGAGSDTLTFASYQVPAFYYLDDVSALPASPTPEPSSILLFGTGLLGFGGILRRRLLA